VGGDVDGWCVVDARLIFCDFAEVSGGKLFISGAGISLVGTSEATPPFPLTAALALLITVPAADTGRPHRLTIELLQFPLPRLGGYTFSAVIDDVEMDRASFRLLPIQQAEEASEGPL
jgi:hypothetical protein